MSEGALPHPSHAARPGEALIFAALLPFVATLAFVLGIALGARGDDVWILALALLTLTVTLTPLALDRGQAPERRHVLFSLFAAAYAVYFGLPPLTAYFWFYERGTGLNDLASVHPRDIINGQLAALLGFVSLVVAYALPVGRFLSHLLPRPQRDWSHGATLVVAIVMIPVGWLVFMSGQLRLIPERAGSGVLGVLATAVFYGFALLTLAYLRFRSRPALLLMALLLPPTMAFTWFTGIKRFFLAPLIVIALTHILVTRRVQMKWVAGGLLTIVLIYPMAQFYRDVVQRGFSMRAMEVLEDPGRAASLMSEYLGHFSLGMYLEEGAYATSKRLSALGIFCVIVRDTPDRVPYQGGWTLSLIPMSYVPRILWPGKPKLAIGQWVTDNYGAGSAGVHSSTGPSWLGELFFNFGYPGLVVGMMIFGVYFRLLHESLLSGQSTIPALLAGVSILFATTPTIQSGLITPVNGVTFNALPIIVTHYLVVFNGGISRSRPVAPT